MFLRLSRYLNRETIGLYLFGIAAFCLLLSIDFLSVWADFLIRQGASIQTIGKLILFKIPFFLHLSMPIASVFAVLLATGRLAKDSELKAAYSLGVPPLRLLSPLLLLGLTISLLALFNNGYLEPKGEIAHTEEVNKFYSQKPPAETQNDVSYVIENQGIYFAGEIRADEQNPNLAQLSGVLISKEDGSRVSAREGIWNSDTKVWTLTEVQAIDRNGDREEVLELDFPFEIEAEVALSLADEETLTIIDLWQRLRSEKRAGREVSELAFAFHRQVADAFNAFIFVLIAGTLGLHLKGRSTGFAWTIILLVIFYFIWTLSENLFDEQLLSAFVAAWFTSLVVGSIGIVLAFIRLR